MQQKSQTILVTGGIANDMLRVRYVKELIERLVANGAHVSYCVDVDASATLPKLFQSYKERANQAGALVSSVAVEVLLHGQQPQTQNYPVYLPPHVPQFRGHKMYIPGSYNTKLQEAQLKTSIGFGSIPISFNQIQQMMGFGFVMEYSDLFNYLQHSSVSYNGLLPDIASQGKSNMEKCQIISKELVSKVMPKLQQNKEVVILDLSMERVLPVTYYVEKYIKEHPEMKAEVQGIYMHSMLTKETFAASWSDLYKSRKDERAFYQVSTISCEMIEYIPDSKLLCLPMAEQGLGINSSYTQGITGDVNKLVSFTIPNFSKEKAELIASLGGVVIRNVAGESKVLIASEVLKEEVRSKLGIDRTRLKFENDYQVRAGFLRSFDDITVEPEGEKFLVTFPAERLSLVTRVTKEWEQVKKEYLAV